MRLNQETDNVEIRGAASAASSFSIAMNPKAFRVLSSNLYQNKIGSIVREISCNASDSHAAAGNPEKQFEIHLPDGFEPWFSVRDFGIGLSPEQVRTILCVYFASTKDQSNDAVGAFGLGAKTPFAYTDQFNVTSVYNGRKYLFAAFINSEGIPDITLMLEEATDEPNGVEVKLPVEKKDFRDFQNEVRTQLRFFPVKPLITNYNGKFEFEEDGEVLFKTDTITIFKARVYGRQPIHIVQGPVGYPLDLNEMNKHLTPAENAFLKFIGEIGANMYFNIGDINVTASREGIEYEGRTIDSIRLNIDAARTSLSTWIKDQLDSKPTVYEKIEFVNDNLAFKNIINGISMDFKPATRNYNDTYQLSLATCPAFQYEVTMGDDPNAKSHHLRGVSINRYNSSGVNGFSSSRGSADDAVLIPSKNARKTVIVLRDTAKTPLAKMKHYFRENKVEIMLVLTATHDSIKMDATFAKALSEHLGGFDKIVRVSDMPEPPKAVYERVRADYSRPTCYLSGNSTDIDSVANWNRVYDKLPDLKAEDGDDIERALYVTVVRQKIEGYYNKQLYKDLTSAGEIDLPLYGIREADEEKLEKTGIEWIKLSDYIEEKRKAIVSDPKVVRYTVAAEAVRKIDGIVGSRFNELPNLHKRAILTRLLRLRKRSQSVMNSLNINTYALRIANHNPSSHKAIEIIDSAGLKVFDKIPMLRYAMRHGYGAITGQEANHITDYINKSHD